jgi:hypothetical protein
VTASGSLPSFNANQFTLLSLTNVYISSGGASYEHCRFGHVHLERGHGEERGLRHRGEGLRHQDGG